MKRFLYVLISVFILACLMSGCSIDEPEKVLATSSQNKLEIVEQMGELPENLRSVVKYNIFKDVTAFENRVLKAEIASRDEENHSIVYDVQMIDFYGNKLASYSIESDDAYSVRAFAATEDGGFLFVLGFSDYAVSQNLWASERGVCSRVIKCNALGDLQFDTGFEGVEGEALRYCFEADNKYYFFGSKETPETKIQGVSSPDDIYMAVLNSKGKIKQTISMGGTDYDNLDFAKMTEDGFVLSVSTQSNDGDFVGGSADGYPVDYVVTVNRKLEITDKKRETGESYFNNKIGERNGSAIYKDDELLKGFDAGRPTALMSYEDFYLIVSENNTGVYENTPPYINSVWYYTETVYSGYDNNGNLIFRASVDSTPDYDALVDECNTIVMETIALE